MGLLQKMSGKNEQAEVAATEKKVTKKKSAKTVAQSTVSAGGKKSGVAFRVLLKPILSEKAAMQETYRSYAFAVVPTATKREIKQAVFQVYGVMPRRVRTLRFEGKSVRFGSTMGRRSDWKKAIVTLKEGESIRIHEGV